MNLILNVGPRQIFKFKFKDKHNESNWVIKVCIDKLLGLKDIPLSESFKLFRSKSLLPDIYTRITQNVLSLMGFHTFNQP